MIKAVSDFIKSKAVTDVFVTKTARFGIDKNFEEGEDKKAITWEHLYVHLNDVFVSCSARETEGAVRGRYRDVRNVFKRSLEEISEDARRIRLSLIKGLHLN